MKLEEKIKVLESSGNMETHCLEPIGSTSILHLACFYARANHLSRYLISQADGKTERAAIHKLYKNVQRRLWNEYRVLRKKNLKDADKRRKTA